jgi:dipeptidyl aminopeptidase/acylaminoacyl peptidase
MNNKKKNDEDLAGVVIWHWKDKRLQSQQQKEEKKDKDFSFLSIYRVKEKKFIRLADEKMRQVTPAPKFRFAIGIDKTPYELKSDLDGRRYYDIYAVDLKTGAKKLAVEKCRWFYDPSFTGSHFLYYKDGHFHTYQMESGKSFNITENLPVSFIDKKNDVNIKNPPIWPIGWEKQGKFVLLYDNWDVWQVPVHGGKGINLTVDGRKSRVRYQRRYQLDPEEKGIDLSKPQYFSAYGEWTKKSGIVRLKNGRAGAEKLLWGDARFGSLMKAGNAAVFFYTKQTYKDYPDFYAAGPLLRAGKKITAANPQQKDFRWSAGVRLIDYTSEQGDKLQAALFLPAGYEAGKSYPTVVYIYEKLSQRLHYYFAPRAAGFNKSLYTNRGYAVLMPDITYKVDDPGLSSVRCVVPAVEAAVKTGIVDKERVGITGHSWGGYQTAFLITRTDTFKAAVAGAALTNMISMYSSIYWNIGVANQSIFESGQGRFSGGFWDNLDAYTRNSPVYYAHKVNTPLLLLHNDEDGAVDWNQGIEYFNALRQLQKPVVMLQYKGENHGLRKPENRRDYTVRMQQFFDHYLMGKPAPRWYTAGVSHLDHEDHIKELAKLQKRKKKEEKAKGK